MKDGLWSYSERSVSG